MFCKIGQGVTLYFRGDCTTTYHGDIRIIVVTNDGIIIKTKYRDFLVHPISTSRFDNDVIQAWQLESTTLSDWNDMFRLTILSESSEVPSSSFSFMDLITTQDY